MIQPKAGTTDRTDPHAARRGVALLMGLTAVPLLLLALGATWAWPLLTVPIALAGVLGNGRGLAMTAAVAALALSLASSRPGADGLAMLVALLASTGLGLVVSLRHDALAGELRRTSTASLTDRLTGLPNYAFMCDTLPRELRRAERYGFQVSLVLLDLDRFKRVNDHYGHEAGNRVLARVGGLIMACARASDIPARFGGEEFAIIVPGPLSEATEAAERIRRAIAETGIALGGDDLFVTVSAGVAEHVAGERLDGADLVARADRALYAAKDAGRDRVMVVRAADGAPVPAATVVPVLPRPRVRRVA
jgi:diguanylate cyclase (GGDEF)-like protein